ncbi:MAG: 50S ribosomal protein L13 [Coriobacteriales bacterium]|nr:50S ribosomal protein L13 [Coriobacteriales bacterium]
MSTFYAKNGEVQRDWVLIDGTDQVLGRVAAAAAQILRGKTKPEYTPHVDTGDFVVVINADKIKLTGNKAEQKVYYRHSGYPGGLRHKSYREQMEKNPSWVVEHAVKGMLPHNTLGREQFKKLKVYAGAEHPHKAQNPKEIKLEA